MPDETMKKLCNKISNQQWRVTVPNINIRKSPTVSDAGKRISTGSYDVQAAQSEFETTGNITQSTIVLSSSESDASYEDANEDELYTNVEQTKVVEVSKNLTEQNNKYEYDVPKICFSFFEKSTLDYDTVRAHNRHKSEVKIVLSTPKEFPENNVIVKAGSDPNLSHNYNEEEVEDDTFYKVPKSLQQNRLSKSLHEFNAEEENLQIVSPSQETIDHISCSQVINENAELQRTDSIDLDYSKTQRRLPRRLSLLRRPRSKAIDTWSNLKTKFNRMMEEQAAQQKVGAFTDKEKLTINIEEMYKTSKDKCKKMFKNTGKIFKMKKEQSDDNNSHIVKNDAFFAKVELKASDIEYVLNSPSEHGSKTVSGANSPVEELKMDLDSVPLKKEIKASRLCIEGQNGFDDLRRYVKQGGDFCKELSTILQERSEAELQYSKSLSKLSSKLSRACREGVGGINEAWKAVAVELELRAEAHRQVGNILLEETAKPLRILTENQHRTRKNTETVVDKAARVLSDWRAAEAKSKKHSHSCARDNEKLQDAMLDSRISRSTSLIQLPNIHKNSADKDSAKLEGKKRKAEDAVKKADIEYYSHCVRSERARLEWESAVSRGAVTFQQLEEERLNNLKSILTFYLNHTASLTPKLVEATNKTKTPIDEAEPAKDLTTFMSLRQSSQQIAEQLLPDFYCEHITLAMNRERRKQALVKLLQLIKLDIERERKSKDGLENLSKAIKQTPNFGSEDSSQNVTEKIYHMKSMLTYLEGSRYKVQSALEELDSMPKAGHPLASHITVTRDKAGLQQSILKVPPWIREQWVEPESSPVSVKRVDIDSDTESHWIDRGTADGNSNQPDSDFDEFSSQGSSIGDGHCAAEENPVKPIAQCKVLYMYTPNLPDELAIRPGDMVSVYRQQDDGWWLGECNGSVGIFPATYVETMSS